MEIEFSKQQYGFNAYLKDLKKEIASIKEQKNPQEQGDYLVYCVFQCLDETLRELDFNHITPTSNVTEYSTFINQNDTPPTSNLLLNFYNQTVQKQRLGKKYDLSISAGHKLFDFPVKIDFCYAGDGASENGISLIIDEQDKSFDFKNIDEIPNLILKIRNYFREKIYQIKKEEIVSSVTEHTNL